MARSKWQLGRFAKITLRLCNELYMCTMLCFTLYLQGSEVGVLIDKGQETIVCVLSAAELHRTLNFIALHSSCCCLPDAAFPFPVQANAA